MNKFLKTVGFRFYIPTEQNVRQKAKFETCNNSFIHIYLTYFLVFDDKIQLKKFSVWKVIIMLSHVIL